MDFYVVFKLDFPYYNDCYGTVFVKKKEIDGMVYQSYVEPKGTHLLEQDSWKEEFSLEIEKKLFQRNCI